MRLTKQTDYAFRILMFCAAAGNRLCRVSDVARAYGASEPFLFKILNPLVEAGLVETVRGRNGGIRLARPAGEITLADVALVTEDTFDMAECFEAGGTDCPLIENCQLTTALRRALDAFFAVLAEVTIDDLSKPSAAVTQLLAMIDNSPKPPDPAYG
ncbi:MAG: iron-responsive transcriptional regulator RirA [Pseudomonadota bacterium]